MHRMATRLLILSALGCSGMLAQPAAVCAQASADLRDEEEVAEITVRANRVANTRPAGGYAALATALRFDPLTELQSRGMPEGQADVTVRGGLFENTGFSVGAVTIIDPQTGHYSAEMPIDPVLLSSPEIVTGIDNALRGFNSNIATIDYSLRTIRAGGRVVIGFGNDNLDFQSLGFAGVTTTSTNADLGIAVSGARSDADGSLPNGDHEFRRFNVQLQRASDGLQTDLILAYQDKFYGWPGAYTGFPSLAETDHTKTTLALANHRHDFERGWLQLGAFYRKLEDDYDFDRTTQESDTPGSFDHETVIYAIGLQGSWRTGRIDWSYDGQFTQDELVRSTDLTSGNFNRRRYVKFGLMPSIQVGQNRDRITTIRFGATIDDTNRDASAVSPMLGLTIRRATVDGTSEFDIQLGSTSQVPGYTALNSRPAGLFGGRADLGREKARQLAVSYAQETGERNGRVTLFFREDDNLVDWTFASGAPFARQANPVDTRVFGVEAVYMRSWLALDLVGGYTFIDKDADYGSALVDASFYALNFARHRATLAVRYRIGGGTELRWDNEYRVQEDNPLRSGSDNAYVTSLSLDWTPGNGRGLGFAVTADNLTDSDYQQFPGTPAVGRQISVSARYDWD